MSEQKKTSDAYHNLRSGFDALEVDEKARFLVEAAMSMVAHGAQEAGNVVSRVVEDMAENMGRWDCDDTEDGGDGPEDGSGDGAESDEAPAGGQAKKAAPRKKAAPKRKTTTRKSTGGGTSRTRKKPAADSGDAKSGDDAS